MANVVTAIGQWLNSAKGKIIAPKTLTKYVFDENGKSVEERFTLINTDAGNTIDVTLNKETYEMTVILKNKNGEELSSKTVDFPMELAFVNASYVEGQKKITFTLQSGAEVEVPLAKLIEGLVNTEDFNAAIDEIKTQIGKYTNYIDTDELNFSENGIDVSRSTNGKIFVLGTATADTKIQLVTNKMIKRIYANADHKLKLVGCPPGGSADTYYLYAERALGRDKFYDYGSGCEIPVTRNDNYYLYFCIKNGTTVGNIEEDEDLEIHPMITNNMNCTYDDYCPYIGGLSVIKTLRSMYININNILKRADNTDTNIKALSNAIEYSNTNLKEYGLNGIHNIDMIDHSYPSSADITQGYLDYNYICSKSYLECNGGDYITLKNKYDIGSVYFFDSTKTFISQLDFPCTAPDNSKYFRFSIGYVKDITVASAGAVSIYINNKIEKAASKIEDLKDNDINIEFLGYSIPDVMSVKNYVDDKGVFHQKVGRIDLSSLSYTYDSGNTQFYSGALSSLPQESKWNYNLYCNKYPTGSTSGDSYIASYGGRIYIRDKNYTNASTLVAALRNTYLYYELVTENLIYPGAEQITQIDDSLSVIGKCKNLISTTLSTTTANGVTCTSNGDGTYTLSGTNSSSSSNVTFVLNLNYSDFPTSAVKLVGCPALSESGKVILQTCYNGTWGTSSLWDTGKGVILENGQKLTKIAILVYPSKNVDGIVIKPMVSTNLNATYNDYVPYTGNSDTIMGDINKIEKDLDIARYGEFSGSKNLFDESAEKFFKYRSSAYMVYQIPFTGYYMLSMSFKKGKTISNLAGISFGGVVTPNKPGTEFKWYINNGAVSTLSFYSNYPFLFIYPGTNESVDKVLSTLNIMIEKSNTVSEYEKYFMSNTNQYNALTNLQKNLLVKQKISTIKGVILGSDGSYNSSYDDYRSTDYIKVLPLTLIKAELAASSDDFSVVFYDENKAYVDKEKRLSGGITKNTIIGYTSINTQYIRICYRAESNLTDYVYLYTTNSDTNIEPIKNAIGSYKNLLNIDKYSYMSGPHTNNGITCTFNIDGTYTVNGTATDNVYFLVENIKEIAKRYVNKPLYLTGCPSDGGPDKYDLRYEINNAAGNGGCILYGASYEIAHNNILSADKITDANIYIAIKKGVTVKNLVFKPMLTEYPTDGYNSFLPPIGSNSNIQNDIFDIKQRQFSRWAQGKSSITINLQGVYLMSYWQGAGWPVVGCGILSSSNYKESSKYIPLVSESSITVTPNGNYTVTIKNNVAAAITMYFTKLSV